MAWIRGWVGVAAMALACAGCPGTGPAPAASTPKVGLVFDIGGKGDKSFNDSAWRGLSRAKSELGLDFETFEPTDGADRESALRMLASRKVPLLFAIGFMFTDDVDRLGAEFPGVKFACVDYALRPGKAPGPNVLALKFKEEEGSYLVGALAALVSKSGTIGFVGGMESPLIRKFEAGYGAGAKAVRPDVTVIASYAGSTGDAFRNPARGKELALAMLARGADVIYHASGSTGLGVFEAVRGKDGALAIGVDSDQAGEAPGKVLTSMVKKVDVAVFEAAKAWKEGRLEGGVKELGLKEGGVDYVYDERNKALVPEEVHAKVEALRERIVRGEVKVPAE
ncbi:MAG TPA: BMP family ABC transporter substrate-binding protein [Planctomycetota bacterium]|nr:BMP family ABC transporter substrate-binding protein [Planctomycetota bacterium]